ncbi:unnamed protein product [Parnassius apollo]|uniref:(apollo) hypothetical protein n=1 Tax=Parnassius apollo TaxID=110799 RepID=A0A8S3YD37_PARAO|nr:unnamed protein product [Parnassius apollo]
MDQARNLPDGNDEIQKAVAFSKEYVDNFRTIFPNIIDEALSKICYLDSWNIRNRIKEMTEYYTLEKKPMLGELMLYAYAMLEDNEVWKEEKRHQAYLLASVIEMGASYFLFTDDIQDDGKTRCGKVCWHLLPNVGTLAINDACMLRSFIQEILQQNFPEPLFYKITKFVNKIFFIAATGQHVDITLARDRNFDNFTMKCYCKMSEMKTAFPFIEVPIIFALILSNKATEESMQQIHNICVDMGVLIQIQNDITDFYDYEGLTKSSTDIQKGKCSWLAVKALELSNEDQRCIFEECYGSWDPTHVHKIRELYKELKLPQLLVQEKEARYETFFRKINELPPVCVPDVNFYQKLFKLIKNTRI